MNYQLAIEDFVKSLELKAREPYIFLWLGHAHLGLGNKNKATELYRKTLEVGNNPKLIQEANQSLIDISAN
jgi:hypothetical protein